tara:strand:- start:8291 stop:9100 length:810 start_codon:yes stop_codon:yes gene_type:complete
MISIGHKIKTTRISKNLSLEKISKELKISKSTLLKIEEEEYLANQDTVFLIGHIRTYSNFLELDSNDIVKNFKDQISFKKNDHIDKLVKPKFHNYSISKFQKFIPATAIFLILTSFYFLFIRETEKTIDYALIPDLPESFNSNIEEENLYISLNNLDNKNNDVNKITDDLSYTSANASKKITLSNENKFITLKILKSTWLQLRDESNNIVISQLMEMDDEYTYDMNLNYNITAGNGGNILVIIDNEVKGKIGKYGEVVDSIILDNNFNN